MREMKDSGIEWIGKIPSTWTIQRIKDAYTLQTGFTPDTKQSDYYDDEDGFDWITIADLGIEKSIPKSTKAKISKKYVSLFHPIPAPQGSLLYSFKLSVGQVAFTNRQIFTNEAIASFLPANDECLNFLYYAAFLIEYNANTNIYGAHILNQQLIKDAHIVNPPIDEQYKIADFLDSKCSEIDTISADIQKEIETLEQYKRSVITEAVTKGLNPDVEMKDSGVAWCPQIPSNWQYSNPKGLFGLRTDRAFRDDRQLTASQEYGIVYQDEYMEKTGNKVVTVTKDFSILKHVEPDDFVISMRSFQGGLEYSDKRGCISSAYVMLIPNKKFVYAPFYRWFFKSSKYINALQSTSNLVRDGQAMRYANFVKVPLFIIPIEEQKAITSYLDEKIEKVNSILAAKKNQLEILLNYKKSLIYEYVTGKKEVPMYES